MYRNNPKHLKYEAIPDGGDIAISPSEGDSSSEKDKLTHFIANVADSRLSDRKDGKVLNVFIGSGLHTFDNYARILPQTNKNTPYTFTQETDGAKAFKQGDINTKKWVSDKAEALCLGAQRAVESNRPELVNSVDQHIYINTPSKNEIYGRTRSFEANGKPTLTLQLHSWHDLWAGQDDALISKIGKTILHFNQGQALFNTLDESKINDAFAGTGLTATLIKEINAVLRLKEIKPFAEAELQYWPQALGLDKNKFMNLYNEKTELKQETSCIVYAKITLAAWFYFKQKTAPHYREYLKAGITQAQIEAVFQANLMFTISELACLTFFPGHILYMVPGSMDKIQALLNSCAQLLFKETLSFPIKATDPKESAALTKSTATSTNTQSTLMLGGGYIGRDKREAILSSCTEFMLSKIASNSLSTASINNSMEAITITIDALRKYEEEQKRRAGLSATSSSEEVLSRPPSDTSKSSKEDTDKSKNEFSLSNKY